MVFESQNGRRIVGPEKQQVLEAIAKLDGVGNSYASLEDDQGNYIQVGGGPIEFTVEVRITAQDGTFAHWKAGLLNSKSDGEKRIIISGSVVRVKSDQVIDINTVKRLFEAFIDGDKLPDIVRWHDMTEMFYDSGSRDCHRG